MKHSPCHSLKASVLVEEAEYSLKFSAVHRNNSIMAYTKSRGMVKGSNVEIKSRKKSLRARAEIKDFMKPKKLEGKETQKQKHQ